MLCKDPALKKHLIAMQLSVIYWLNSVYVVSAILQQYNGGSDWQQYSVIEQSYFILCPPPPTNLDYGRMFGNQHRQREIVVIHTAVYMMKKYKKNNYVYRINEYSKIEIYKKKTQIIKSNVQPYRKWRWTGWQITKGWKSMKKCMYHYVHK